MSSAAGTRPGQVGRASGPAPWWRRVLRQAGWDLRAVLRNGEQLLVTFLLPVAVLVGVVRTGVPDLSPLPQPQAALAGALGVAVVSSAFTGQAIALAFDRRAGVLRLLATTPLGRGGLVAARVLAVTAVVALQVVLLLLAGAVLGVPLDPAGVAAALPALLLGTAAMLSAGLLLAGTVRPEGVLGLANLVWVAVLVGGGLVLPVAATGAGAVPGLETGLGLLPTAALGEALRAALVDGRLAPGALLLLLGWTAVLAALAGRTLRWD
ncbi:ABC transporter permease [Jannaschia sp. R86511]|uniref:ABC transporter permease n=1 Tax=Jannaschia sp. R86511 TaxID=3093853 RepID=UPI0036D30AEB